MLDSSTPNPRGDPRQRLRAVDLWAIFGLILVLWLAWRLFAVLMLLFAGVLFALVLRSAMRLGLCWARMLASNSAGDSRWLGPV